MKHVRYSAIMGILLCVSTAHELPAANLLGCTRQEMGPSPDYVTAKTNGLDWLLAERRTTKYGELAWYLFVWNGDKQTEWLRQDLWKLQPRHLDLALDQVAAQTQGLLRDSDKAMVTWFRIGKTPLDAGLEKKTLGKAILLLNQGSQDVLVVELLVLEAGGEGLGVAEGELGVFGEAIEVHG